jgi:glutaredoxin
LKVYLYSTLGCHLCEQAKQLLWPLVIQYQFRLMEIDIADDDALISRYGIHIPVVGSPASERELNWPFNREEVDIFFAELAGV